MSLGPRQAAWRWSIGQPRQIRDFARATGQLAKTDTLDARVITHRFGLHAIERALCRRRSPRSVQHHLDAHIAWLEEALADLEADLTTLIRSNQI
jgi:hypothetical protein